MTTIKGSALIANSAEHQSRLLNALPQIVLELGDDNQILYVNAQGEQYFSASSSLLRRSRLDELFAFDSPIMTLMAQARQANGSIGEYNVQLDSIRHKQIELMDVQVRPISADEPTFLLVMQPRSITRKIEQQLVHQGAVRSASGLASMLAHEIRNPLSGIKGAAQLLETDLALEDRVLTKLIVEETDRISRLVGRMEVFGEHTVFERREINIHSVLGHVLTLASSGFAKDIEFVEDYDPSLPPLSGNRDLLVQLFVNLVKNAAEAITNGSKKGRIWLTTSYRQGVRFTASGSNDKTNLPLQITVEDSGPGVPGDITDYLFDPFVTSKTNGSGLGLAMVARCVRDHGGIIEVERRFERTIFRVMLPQIVAGNGEEADHE